MLPVGNRPFLEYWIEQCVDFGIKDIRVVLGDGAEFVEAYAGDGERWGVSITYSFLKEGLAPEMFLQRDPGQWRDGLFALFRPVFLHRTGTPGERPPFPGGVFLDRAAQGVNAVLSDSPEFIDAFIANPTGLYTARAFQELALQPSPVASVKAYYDLNMQMVGGGAARHVKADYSLQQDVGIGYNVVIPPSATLTPPLAIGNNGRIGAMTTVGPRAVVGNHVIIDRQSALSQCVILDGTYIGRGVEIEGKIVAGRRLIDPESEAIVEIGDPWLVARVRPFVRMGDVARALLGWLFALIMVLLQAGPFAVLYPVVKLMKAGRFHRQAVHLPRGRVGPLSEFIRTAPASRLATLFQALNLDLFPRFWSVVAGRLWLCGVRPMAAPAETSLRNEISDYFPAVLVFDTDERDYAEPGGHLAHGLYYARFRSLSGDVRMMLSLLLVRPLKYLSMG